MRFVWFFRLVAIAVLVVVIVLFIPLPVLVFGPGAAVDLNGLVSVPQRTPPPGHFYLTDVSVFPGRPLFYVMGKLLPGYEVVPRAEYAGNQNESQFTRELSDAMSESQTVAQVVAERAAGLPVKIKTTTSVAEVNAAMPGARCFKVNDVIESIDGRVPTTPNAVPATTQTKPVGSTFDVVVQRAGKPISVQCKTAMYKGKARFGIIISTTTRPLSLPVHVAFNVKDINGSSAGLMFALQIYRTLTGRTLAHGEDVAGSGVLAVDGQVLPVGGAKEKLAAAITQHAAVFLVPEQDYNSIRDTRGITIVPVKSFDGALKTLEAL